MPRRYTSFKDAPLASCSLARSVCRTRVVIPGAAVCYLLLGGIIRQYGFFFHTGIVPLYVLLVLSFTPCGDGWSLDRLLKARRGHVALRPAAVYGWARYACWVAIAVPYLAAGLSKLRNGGLLWWTADNMRSMLYSCTLQPLNFDWQVSLYLHPAPDVVFSALGLTVLITELAFVAVLFSRTARLLCPTIMMLSQVGIIFLQNILFVDLLVLAACFADASLLPILKSWWATIRARWSPRGAFITPASATTAPCPDSPPATAHSPWPAAAVAGLICLLVTCWLWRIEGYPFTAMQMFSGTNRSGTVDFYKVLAHHATGDSARISLTDVLGAEADFRYRYHLQGAFNPLTAPIATQYLALAGTVLNRHAPPGNRVTRLEVQHWQWNFRAQPQSPTYGQPIDSFVVELGVAASPDGKRRAHTGDD